MSPEEILAELDRQAMDSTASPESRYRAHAAAAALRKAFQIADGMGQRADAESAKAKALVDASALKQETPVEGAIIEWTAGESG